MRILNSVVATCLAVSSINVYSQCNVQDGESIGQGISMIITGWEHCDQQENFDVSRPNFYAFRMMLTYADNSTRIGGYVIEVVYKDITYTSSLPPRALEFYFSDGTNMLVVAGQSRVGIIEGTTVYTFDLMHEDTLVNALKTKPLDKIAFVDNRTKRLVHYKVYSQVFTELCDCLLQKLNQQ